MTECCVFASLVSLKKEKNAKTSEYRAIETLNLDLENLAEVSAKRDVAFTRPNAQTSTQCTKFILSVIWRFGADNK